VPRVPTHYDNLKVSRDAPIEVIRAAYRSLASKYHPDIHPNRDKATRIMRISSIRLMTYYQIPQNAASTTAGSKPLSEDLRPRHHEIRCRRHLGKEGGDANGLRQILIPTWTRRHLHPRHMVHSWALRSSGPLSLL
jgi:hypothetical protein